MHPPERTYDIRGGFFCDEPVSHHGFWGVTHRGLSCHAWLQWSVLCGSCTVFSSRLPSVRGHLANLVPLNTSPPSPTLLLSFLTPKTILALLMPRASGSGQDRHIPVPDPQDPGHPAAAAPRRGSRLDPKCPRRARRLLHPRCAAARGGRRRRRRERRRRQQRRRRRSVAQAEREPGRDEHGAQRQHWRGLGGRGVQARGSAGHGAEPDEGQQEQG